MVTEQDALVEALMTDRVKLFMEGLSKHKVCFRYHLAEDSELKGLVELYQSQVGNKPMVLQFFVSDKIESDAVKAFMELVLKQGLEIVLYSNSLIETRIATNPKNHKTLS